MAPEVFKTFAGAFPEALALVRSDGTILACNSKAADLGLTPESGTLFDVSLDAPEKLRSFLGLCARSGQMVIGSIRLALPNSAPTDYRAEGCRPARESVEILLRLTRTSVASRSFNLLTEKVQQLTESVRHQMRLSQQLQEAKRQIEEHSRNLETIVRERTAELLEANASLESFAYSIAHDLRAPLRAVRGFVDMLTSDSEMTSDERQLYLQRITSAVAKMDELLLAILQFATVGKAHIQMGKISLGDELKHALSVLADPIQRCNAIVEFELLPCVKANAAAVQQVFANLISNSLKFARPGVQIRVDVRARSDGDTVTVFVCDNGIGIPREYHDKVFGLFERLDQRFAGTGAGLAIAKKAVERMGGTIGVESAPGQGSVFWFRLPAA